MSKTEAKHTPGPCAACTHPQAEILPGERLIQGTVKEAVCCTIHGRGTLGSPLHIHSCPLHAAAPELLEALEVIAPLWHDGHDLRDKTTFADCARPHCVQMRAAIRKAKGGE